MDFVSDALANGRRIKVLTIVDDFSKDVMTQRNLLNSSR
jgi:putative transposase